MEIIIERAGVSTKYRNPMGYVSSKSGTVYTTYEPSLIRIIEGLNLQSGDIVELESAPAVDKNGNTIKNQKGDNVLNIVSVERIIRDEIEKERNAQEPIANDYATGQEMGNARQCAARILQGLVMGKATKGEAIDLIDEMSMFDVLVKEILKAGK